jgi:hypothetical protein
MTTVLSTIGHIEPEEVADIFVRVFSNLIDDMALEIVLTGIHQGVWLASVFSWLLPKEVCVVVDSETIRGGPSGYPLGASSSRNCDAAPDPVVWSDQPHSANAPDATKRFPTAKVGRIHVIAEALHSPRHPRVCNKNCHASKTALAPTDMHI